MEKETPHSRSTERWAHFRFSVIGRLLSAPARRGELQLQLGELAATKWRHPISGEWVTLGLSTIERWYYKALRSQEGPVEVLKRKVRCDHGTHPAVGPSLAELLVGQHRQHPGWSYQLHADNLAVRVEQEPQLGPMPSYGSVLRFMKRHGLFKRPRRGPAHSPGAQRAERRYEARETPSNCSEDLTITHTGFVRNFTKTLSQTAPVSKVGLVSYVKTRAAGNCEWCSNRAPFTTDSGEPFLEVHHIFRLADDGPDLPINAAALCPNCHRRAHYGTNLVDFKEQLSWRISQKESNNP